MTTPTPEEQARMDVMRDRLGQLPEGVEVDFQVLDSDDMVREIATNEAAVFVKGAQFGFYKAPGLGTLPAVEVTGLEWLEHLVRAGRVTCIHFGIGKEIEGVDVGLFAHFRLNVAPLYIWLTDAPADWLELALQRFIVVWPPGLDGQRAYLATGPMTQHPEGRLFVPPRVGRNAPCPCGSGTKFKRCHGA